MSDPLLVDAIEDQFVPLCIYNNVKGEDARILKKFKEPSWNNPVTRILRASDGATDRMAPNRTGWSVAAVARQMTAALKKRGRAVPGYLALLTAEANATPQKTENAVFGMT